ncbi:MAG: hypothetical protein AAF733_12700, partial [Verrucomicrobiota bacterium]
MPSLPEEPSERSTESEDAPAVEERIGSEPEVTSVSPSSYSGWRAGVVGDSRGGGFGHAMDTMFRRMDGV